MKGNRRYTKSHDVESLAEQVYLKRDRGITFMDLVTNGLVQHKAPAQAILKRCRQNNILFTPENRRPQQYYPFAMKSKVMKSLFLKNDRIHPTGVKSNFTQFAEELRLHTLREFVLPLLPDTPLECHNLHLKTKIRPEFYEDLDLVPCSSNRGKTIKQRVDWAFITCTVYPRGTVDIQVACSDDPFKIETYDDFCRILIFLGQIKEFVMMTIADPHQRTIPDVMEWELTEVDINKDVPISDAFLFGGLKTQAKIRVRDFEYVLRIYFKERGPDTVSRIEISLNPKLSVSGIISPLLLGLFGLSAEVPDKRPTAYNPLVFIHTSSCGNLLPVYVF